MENHEELIQELKYLIGSNRTEKALELLAKAQLSDLDKDLIILNSRYSKVKEDQRLGVIDHDLAQRRLNTINRDLLELSEKIGKRPIKTVSSITSSNEKAFNKWWIIAPLLLAGGIALFIILNDNPEEKAWQEARKVHSPESYSTFIRDYPEGDSVDVAKNYLEELIWQEAQKENKLSSYMAFIEKYPEGEFTSQAYNEIEDFTWKNALAKNTVAAYETYKESYKENGKYLADADKKIVELNAISLSFVYGRKGFEIKLSNLMTIDSVKNHILDKYEEDYRKIDYKRQYIELVVDRDKYAFDSGTGLDEEKSLKQLGIKNGIDVTIQAKEVQGGYYFGQSGDKVFLNPGDATIKKDKYDIVNDVIRASTYKGYSDWRMPRKEELRAVLAVVQKEPELFPIFENGSYWTSSTSTSNNHITINFNPPFSNRVLIDKDKGEAFGLPIRGIK